MELRPGEVWWARPEPSVGREQRGRRPVLVVAGAQYLLTVTTLVIVVPLTSTDQRWPNHVAVRGEVDLPGPTFAMTEQVRAVSRDRLVSRVGRVSPRCLAEARTWVIDYLTD